MCVYILLIMVFFSGCSEKNKEAYFSRGDSLQQQLIGELSGVQTLQDLFDKEDSLVLLFDEIAQLAVEAREVQNKKGSSWEIPKQSSEISSRLSSEIHRILHIPGARPCLEKYQSRAIARLKRFEQMNAKCLESRALRE